MSIWQRLSETRHRRRTTSALDSASRRIVRRIERAIRFAISTPLGSLLATRRLVAPLPLDSINAVLIFRYDALGDAVLTTPVWRTLKQCRAGIVIGVVGSSRNIRFLETDPDIDHVYRVPSDLSLTSLATLRSIRKQKWDVVINVSLSDKSWGAILARLVAPKAYRTTISRDKHEKYEKLYSRVGIRPPLHPPTPFSEQNLLALRTAIELGDEPVNATPSIVVDENVLTEIRGQTARILAERTKTRYAVLNTDAAQSFREWGYDRSLELTHELERRIEDLVVLWTSAPNRSSLSQRFLTEHGEIGRYLATPSVRHLAAAIHDSCLVISPDTSVIHFAVALQKPIVGLYFERSEFSPYSDNSVVLVPPKGGMVADIPLSDALQASLALLRV